MNTFVLVLMLFESFTFGGAATPKLRRQGLEVRDQRSVSASDSQPPAPVCSTDENGELTCYPIDASDKFRNR
jgi:hypothetical protein